MSTALRTPGQVAVMNLSGVQTIVQARTGRSIADVIGDMPVDHANAAFIVQAWNLHDELVAALRGVVAVADRKTDEFDRARAVLAKADA